MTSVLRHRYGRALGAAALSVALISGGTAGAYAASPKPTPTPTSTTHMTVKASITLTVNKTSVKAGQAVKLTGRTKGLKIGSPLVLQHLVSGKWTNLKATTTVKKGSSYAMMAKLPKGTHHLRVASVSKSGKVVSPTVTVKVS
ncbi:hypothetical protein [Streptomyces roseochromogenus]|uniref:Bacterial Ig-like domain-containing protein n=1 Tax=Streptomyces roseochromogenus subsp. oscitans DS 12.976 TaxID=1352936 RepID=V6JWH9_STRRC|nr:hypothetical protein [Streptomyces roseochromogenus]EST24157.1 hypothetical protein M878_31225 [Streptomyces roseochromogenus subsp. oscitans DS 12.976]